MLEKIKTFIKKHDNIFIIIILTAMTIGISFNQKIENGDEVWVFQTIYKLYNGCKIYVDINLITTPLFYYIGLGLFKIIGANILTLRIYNEILLISIGVLTYQILKKIGLTKAKSLASLLVMIIWLNLYEQTLTVYNGLSLILCLIGILNLIKQETKKQPYIQGIIIFLILMTKQNVGVYYGIGLIIYEIISNKKNKDKIKRIIKEILTTAIGISIFIILMQNNGLLEGFLNYVVYSIKEFSAENISLITESTTRIIMLITGVILSIIIIKNKKIKITQKTKENIKILAIFSIVLSFMIYPLSNEHHSILGFYVSYILIIYLILEIVAKELIKEVISLKVKKIIAIIGVIPIVVLAILNIINLQNWVKETQKEIGTPYFGGVLEKETKEKIEKVNEYINKSNKKTIILSSKAALYNIPEKRNNKEYDLPLKGNLGKDGEEGLIKKINQLKNTEILIEKDEKEIFWQESKKIREYIVENLTLKGEIEEFLIYESKCSITIDVKQKINRKKVIQVV